MSQSEPLSSLSAPAQALYNAMCEFPVIDCHEHIKPERLRVSRDVDVFDLILRQYSQHDARVAGMTDDEFQAVFNHEMPVEQRWGVFEPWWRKIRWCSYARAVLLAAREFYGAEDINRHTCANISEKMRLANKPGLYDRVLGEACNIEAALTQCYTTDTGSERLKPVMPIVFSNESWLTFPEEIEKPSYIMKPTPREWPDLRVGRAPEPPTRVNTLDDFLDIMRSYVARVKQEGAVGVKMMANPFGKPDHKKAADAFAGLRDGKELPVPNALRDYVLDQTIRCATQHDLVVAVHTGYWGDFRMLAPSLLIPVLECHPDARFDVYHLGYPYVREALMLGKSFPNVWINFCWTHVISQTFAREAADEALDLLPTNKVLAFGADYDIPVELVYGHLVMARENIAAALARRVERKWMTLSQAVEVAHAWFYDNPKRLYQLGTASESGTVTYS